MENEHLEELAAKYAAAVSDHPKDHYYSNNNDDDDDVDDADDLDFNSGYSSGLRFSADGHTVEIAFADDGDTAVAWRILADGVIVKDEEWWKDDHPSAFEDAWVVLVRPRNA